MFSIALKKCTSGSPKFILRRKRRMNIRKVNIRRIIQKRRQARIWLAKIGSREVIEIQKYIDAKSPGIYELEEIFGVTMWKKVVRPRKLGAEFSRLVKAGVFKNIRQLHKKSNKHMLYEIV